MALEHISLHIISLYNNNTSLLLSHCWVKASSHKEKAWALIAMIVQDGLPIIIIFNLGFFYFTAENVLQFMNKHWRPVVKELQTPVFNVNVKKLVLNFNRYLKSVPLEYILVDV